MPPTNSMTAQIAVGGMAVVVLVVLCIRGIDVTARTQAVLLTVQFAMLALVSVVALGKVYGHHAGPAAVMPAVELVGSVRAVRIGNRPTEPSCVSSFTGDGTRACRYRRRLRIRTGTPVRPPC